MSKYVNKKHGLVVGSDNHFFVVGDGDYRGDYRAIVWPGHYTFDDVTSLNYFVRTPAQQIIWEQKEETKDLEIKYVLNPWIIRWLVSNVGEYKVKWDARSVTEDSSDSIFFLRRTDALSFVKMIDETLKGMRYGR